MASDLISRKALLKVIEDRYVSALVQVNTRRTGKTIHQGIACGMNFARNAILEQPTVCAEPVRHGRWMLENAGFRRVTFDGYMHCPNCNERFMRIVGTQLFKRCPECGCVMDAKMKGSVE